MALTHNMAARWRQCIRSIHVEAAATPSMTQNSRFSNISRSSTAPDILYILYDKNSWTQLHDSFSIVCVCMHKINKLWYVALLCLALSSAVVQASFRKWPELGARCRSSLLLSVILRSLFPDHTGKALYIETSFWLLCILPQNNQLLFKPVQSHALFIRGEVWAKIIVCFFLPLIDVAFTAINSGIQCVPEIGNPSVTNNILSNTLGRIYYDTSINMQFIFLSYDTLFVMIDPEMIKLLSFKSVMSKLTCAWAWHVFWFHTQRMAIPWTSLCIMWGLIQICKDRQGG